MSEMYEALAALADDYRARYHYSLGRSDEWYVVFPNWLVHHGGRTVEQFAVEWEESVKRMAGLPLGNLVGFEYEAVGGVYRHRASWLAGESPETPEKENPA